MDSENGNQVDKEKNQMESTDMERYFAQTIPSIREVLTARPKQRCMKNKKKAATAAIIPEKDKGKPKLEKMELRKIPSTIWTQVEANRRNLKEAQLWDFILLTLEDQDDDRLRQFLKNSNFGARSTVPIDEHRIQFTAESVAKVLKLFQGEGSMDTEVSDMRDEDLTPSSRRTTKPVRYSLCWQRQKESGRSGYPL